MSAAYSCTVRSLEKRPIPATLRTDIRAQSSARLYVSAARRWHST